MHRRKLAMLESADIWRLHNPDALEAANIHPMLVEVGQALEGGPDWPLEFFRAIPDQVYDGRWGAAAAEHYLLSQFNALMADTAVRILREHDFDQIVIPEAARDLWYRKDWYTYEWRAQKKWLRDEMQILVMRHIGDVSKGSKAEVPHACCIILYPLQGKPGDAVRWMLEYIEPGLKEDMRAGLLLFMGQDHDTELEVAH